LSACLSGPIYRGSTFEEASEIACRLIERDTVTGHDDIDCVMPYEESSECLVRRHLIYTVALHDLVDRSSPLIDR
jgi:hypothetical protein